MSDLPVVVTKEMIRDLKDRGLYAEAQSLHNNYLLNKKKNKVQGEREIHNIRCRIWQSKNREKVNAYARKHYEENKQKIREIRKNYHAKNKDEINKQARLKYAEQKKEAEK